MQANWGGGHNVNKILTWHLTVPPCTTTTCREATRTYQVWYNSIDVSKSWWGTFPTTKARNPVSHYMVNHIPQNMSNNYRFGSTSSVPPLQRGTYHAEWVTM